MGESIGVPAKRKATDDRLQINQMLLHVNSPLSEEMLKNKPVFIFTCWYKTYVLWSSLNIKLDSKALRRCGLILQCVKKLQPWSSSLCMSKLTEFYLLATAQRKAKIFRRKSAYVTMIKPTALMHCLV